MAEVVEGCHALGWECRHFGSHPCLLVLVERQEIGGPEQQSGRSLVSSEDHCRALIAYLVSGNRLARFGIACRDQEIEQVVMARVL